MPLKDESNPDQEDKMQTYDPSRTNSSLDNYENAFTIYEVLADHMAYLLEQEPDVTGLLYFHFDAWIDPAGFRDMDYTKLWFLAGARPVYRCFQYNETDNEAHVEWPYDWWVFQRGRHMGVLDGLSELSQQAPYDNLNLDMCVGWADMYYVPRRFFAQYIELSRLFLRHSGFHEVAIATIFNAMDQSNRGPTDESNIDFLTDCWGSCCSGSPNVTDLLQNRCGHRVDWQDPEMTYPVLARLAEQERFLQ